MNVAIVGCGLIGQKRFKALGEHHLVAVADTQEYERIHKQHLSRLPHVALIRSSFALRAVCQRRVIALD